MKSKILLISPFIIALFSLHTACKRDSVSYKGDFQIVQDASNSKKNPYFIDVKRYPQGRSSLPIGVFDSGTGGLSVLNSIVTLDEFNNQTHEPGRDGVPDFISEKFIYLADEANMPYGRYSAEGKTDFLQELVLKDVMFLLGRQYYSTPLERQPLKDKEAVKSIVIACNTATAFGLEIGHEAMAYWDLDVEITGIIGAGAKTAIESLTDKNLEKSVVGILATEGTCDSESYPRAVRKSFAFMFIDEIIETVQQAGIGLAGAIDGDINYLDPNATRYRPEDEYYGPGLNNLDYPINMDLWEEYNFEAGDGLLLEKSDGGEISTVQLNSVTNYVRYMVTHLVNNIVNSGQDLNLDAVILGCTHYPYVEKEIREHFDFLRNFGEPYDRIIPDEMVLIDPAKSLAIQLYKQLNKSNLFANNDYRKSEFYISVPNSLLADNDIDEKGEFPYSWKYGRDINTSLQFVKRVPFSDKWIKPEVKERIREDYPICFDIIYPQGKER